MDENCCIKTDEHVDFTQVYELLPRPMTLPACLSACHVVCDVPKQWYETLQR